MTLTCVLVAGVFAVPPGRAQTIATAAGTGTAGYSGDNGPATSAQIDTAYGVAVDAQGNVYIADTRNHCIRKIANGTITVAAGTPRQEGSSGDGGSATAAKLSYPRGVAVDASGNLYIADTGNSRVRRVANGTISAFAGTGAPGFSGDNGQATSAQLNYPRGLAVDSAGRVYIADSWNFRVRMVTPGTGLIQTVAGNGSNGPFGDGGLATAASIGVIEGLALDAQNNLYLSDPYNHRVRKVTSGTISTYAGSDFGPAVDGGSASTATLKFPKGLAVDALGNMFLSDSLNFRVRRVAPGGGSISTVAGSGTAGSAGDAGPATAAQLNGPAGLAADSSGRLFIADLWNNRIRQVQTGGAAACGCDVNGDGATNIADVQLIVNQALGLALAACDINGDGAVNIADVQKVINAALGLGCK